MNKLAYLIALIVGGAIVTGVMSRGRVAVRFEQRANVTASPSASPLTRSLLTYVGAFSVPHQDDNDHPLGYSGHALGYDLARHGLFFGGHDWYQVMNH